MLIHEKIAQAAQILNELAIDCWLTFVRESNISRDPALNFLIESDVTWHSAFLVTRTGQSIAIVGQMDRQAVTDLGVYSEVLGYVHGIRQNLQEVLARIQPEAIALNYSKASEVCDGLTHGLFLTLTEILEEIGYQERIISAEGVISRLRARKTGAELALIEVAVNLGLEIFDAAAGYIRSGLTEKGIAEFMLRETEKRRVRTAWDEHMCPSVFTGPETAEAHYQPTDRAVAPGHLLNIDFGVMVEGYCSDLQRTFYVLEEGQADPPPEVQRGFDTIVRAIDLARQGLKPGVQGIEIDAIARQYIVSEGFEEYPHALGHQVGRFVHDGTALLGPAWEKYAQKPFELIEEGMVFTLEPRLKVPGRGVVTVEEMVVVRKDGAEFLGTPQLKLILAR